MLDREQIRAYQEHGYLVVDNIFSPAEVTALRDAVESPEVVEKVYQSGGESNTVHLLELTAKHPAFLNLARDSRIIERLMPLIGPNIQLQHSKLATQAKKAGTGGFGWHQDFAFFPHTNTDLVAVMVMLDDATPENGCMSMLRGSHQLGLRNHSLAGAFVGGCQEKNLWEDNVEDVIPCTPRAGGISIHHCLTLHGSGANISGNPRRGIVFQYRASDAYQLADTVWVDTGLQVAGEWHGRIRCDAGLLMMPRRGSSDNFGSAWNQEGNFARLHNGK